MTLKTTKDANNTMMVAAEFTQGEPARWIYDLNGVTQIGTLSGAESTQLHLCAIAHAASKLQSGSSVSIIVSDFKMAALGKRLAIADALTLVLPFLPLVPAHRSAWFGALRQLEGIKVSWVSNPQHHPSLFDILERKSKQTVEVAA